MRSGTIGATIRTIADAIEQKCVRLCISRDDSACVKPALVAGITGHDGSYLAEVMISIAHEIH